MTTQQKYETGNDFADSPYRLEGSEIVGWKVSGGGEPYDFIYPTLTAALAAIRDFERQDAEAAELAAEQAADGGVPDLAATRAEVLELLDALREWAAGVEELAELERALTALQAI